MTACALILTILVFLQFRSQRFASMRESFNSFNAHDIQVSVISVCVVVCTLLHPSVIVHLKRPNIQVRVSSICVVLSVLFYQC